MKSQEKRFAVEAGWVQWTRIGSGTIMYAFFVPEMPTPLGLVWGVASNNGTKSLFQVWHSYTLPIARRLGIRTKLNAEIFKSFDIITTGEGSAEGGAEFMKSQGYRKIKETGDYFLVRPKVK